MCQTQRRHFPEIGFYCHFILQSSASVVIFVSDSKEQRRKTNVIQTCAYLETNQLQSGALLMWVVCLKMCQTQRRHFPEIGFYCHVIIQSSASVVIFVSDSKKQRRKTNVIQTCAYLETNQLQSGELLMWVVCLKGGLRARSKSVCSREVLRPAESNKVFRGFPSCDSNAELLLNIHFALEASDAVAQTPPSHCYQNFAITLPPQTENSAQTPNSFPLPHTPTFSSYHRTVYSRSCTDFCLP